MRHARSLIGLFVVTALVSAACGRSTIGTLEAPLGAAGAGGAGGAGCEPATEACNGTDDDCDGAVDEGCACNPGQGRACGVGVCAGAQSCVDGIWGDCIGGAQPGPEACNGLDDDCNGSVDEGCTCIDGAAEVCGSNLGECQEGKQLCTGGTWGPCEGSLGPEPEACDGLDNDCDGAADEDCPCAIGSTMTCGTDVGQCVHGTQTCDGGNWGPCLGSIGPMPEACNGVDDDCDGASDEDCECIDGEVTTCGTDVGACELGAMVCMGGFWGPCEGGIEPTLEACNGLDDDCDGSTDEGFALGQACDGPDADFCADDVTTCSGCSAGPDNVEECNGIDEDCNGILDDGCTGQPCAADVLVTDISPSSGGCFIDAPIVGDLGTVDFACDGGAATLDLGDIHFTGTVVAGQVTLVATTQYAWFGCTVQSTQHVDGSLGTGLLSYSYSEVIVSGSGCGNACTATGALSVLE